MTRKGKTKMNLGLIQFCVSSTPNKHTSPSACQSLLAAGGNVSTRKDFSGVSENRFGLSSSELSKRTSVTWGGGKTQTHNLQPALSDMYVHTLLHPRELEYTEESRLLRIKCQNKPEIFKRRRRNFSTEIRLKKMQRWKLNEALKMKTGRKLCGCLAVIQAIEGGLLVYPRNTSVIKLL